MRRLQRIGLATIVNLTALAALAPLARCQVIWNGPSIGFSKVGGADSTLAANQDRVTDTVWLTRGNSAGLYNAFSETGYTVNSSPAGTEWAFGTTADLGSLTFQAWQLAVGSNPLASVGQDMVLHLVDDDVYLDIRFDAWGSGSAGGGSFSYTRATPVPEPAVIALVAIAVGAAVLSRRR